VEGIGIMGTRFGEVVTYLVSGSFDGFKHQLRDIERAKGLPARYLSMADRVTYPGVDKVVAVADYFHVDPGQLTRVIADPSLPLDSLKPIEVREDSSRESAARDLLARVLISSALDRRYPRMLFALTLPADMLPEQRLRTAQEFLFRQHLGAVVADAQTPEAIGNGQIVCLYYANQVQVGEHIQAIEQAVTRVLHETDPDVLYRLTADMIIATIDRLTERLIEEEWSEYSRIRQEDAVNARYYSRPSQGADSETSDT